MSEHAKAVRKFKQILENSIRVVVTDGVIKAVNEPDFTCTVTISEIDFYKVPLKVLISATQPSVVEVPAVGSACTVVFKDKTKDRPTLLSVDQSDKLLLKIGASTLEVTDGLFKFNAGTLDGMVLVNALVTKLNNLETDINNLKTAFATWITVPQDGGAALKLITTTWFGSSLTPTIKADIENTKIKQ